MLQIWGGFRRGIFPQNPTRRNVFSPEMVLIADSDDRSLTGARGMGYFYALPPVAASRQLFPVTKSKPENPQSFEAALAEIENIVAKMEAGQLPLDQSLTAYKRGAELLQFCQARLQEAQQQVKMLEAGTLKNFDGDDSTE